MCEPHTPVSSPAAPYCSLLGGLLRAGRPDVHNFRPVNFYKSHKASGGVHKFGTKILGMNRYIKRSAAPDGQTDEQHQEWLLAHASEHFAKVGKTDNQRKRLRLTADVSAALEDDAGGSTFLSSVFLFAPPLSPFPSSVPSSSSSAMRAALR